MLGKARLYAPGVLHHLVIRGIEQKPIFKDSLNRHRPKKMIVALPGLFGNFSPTLYIEIKRESTSASYYRSRIKEMIYGKAKK